MREKRVCIIAGRYPTAGVWACEDGGYREVWRGEEGARATSHKMAEKVAARFGYRIETFCPICGCYPTIECATEPHDPLFVETAKVLREGEDRWRYLVRSKVEEEVLRADTLPVY